MAKLVTWLLVNVFERKWVLVNVSGREWMLVNIDVMWVDVGGDNFFLFGILGVWG